MITNIKEIREKAVDRGLLIFTEQDKGVYILRIFKPKATRPYLNISFYDEKNRDMYIEEELKKYNEHLDEVAKRKIEKQGTPELLELVQIGSIFKDTWGYDQTNVDFYQVVSKKGSFVGLRQLKQTTETVGNNDYGYTLPCKDEFASAEILKKKVSFHKGTPYVKSTFGWCKIWNGKKVSCSWGR